MSQPDIIPSGIVAVSFGERIRIIDPVNLYGCDIGDDCFIGPFVEIQKNVVVGPRTKIQSHAFICELVSIGADCFISHGVKFVNDTFSDGGPAQGERSRWKSTVIGDNVAVGTGAIILPVEICDFVTIGAGSVVTKNVMTPGIYAGNPARLIRRL